MLGPKNICTGFDRRKIIMDPEFSILRLSGLFLFAPLRLAEVVSDYGLEQYNDPV